MSTKIPGMPFGTAVTALVAEARELIRDGAADDLTAADLALADQALAGSRRPEHVAALAEVAALGADYLLNVDRDLAFVSWAGGTPEIVASLVRDVYGKGLPR